MQVPTLEKGLGMEVYATQSEGIGGRIRQFPEDFVVEELLIDRSRAEVSTVTTQEPVGSGRYLICVLVKRDWDTLLAVKTIAARLGISRKRIRVAGMKDTKALTAQHISLQRVSPTMISQLNIKDIILRPIRFSGRRIFTQLLLGNKFQVRIRALSSAYSEIKRRVEDVENELVRLRGFSNFYGHQRFGTIRPITHVVGRFLTRGELEKAILAFLAHPSKHEHPRSRDAREKLLQTQDFKEALPCFPRHLRYERLMIGHLAKHPRDFVGAFRELPLKLRKLFVQAYQSFLFNRFLSERVRRGIPLSEAQVGDYAVRLDDHGLPAAEFTQVTSSSLQTVKGSLRNCKMRLAIPLVGYEQSPSKGVQGEIEKEILETEDVNPRDFRISFMPEVSAPGQLRAALVSPINLSIEEPSTDLVDSSKRETSLVFTLHRGSYATVLLREFMKPKDLIEAGF